MVVYKILNKKTGRFYIGSTINFEIRKLEHLGQLKNNKHCNRGMQSDFNTYGIEAFDIYILFDNFKSRQEMLLKEYELILQSFKENYNIDKTCPIALATKKKRRKLTRPHKNDRNMKFYEIREIQNKKAKYKKPGKKKPKASNKIPSIDNLLENKRLREEKRKMVA